MKKLLALASACVAISAVPHDAHAGHHQWIITELYSNHDGTIQFVELKGTANNEGGIAPFTVNTTGTILTSAPLAPNLPAATLGAYLLVATPGYATLAATQGAPAPDRTTLPNNFLQLDADTVIYAGLGGQATRSYTAGVLPVGGIDSLDFENPGSAVNSPQNFAGLIGTITAPAPPAPVTPVPALPRWGLVLLIGGFVGCAAIALRRRAKLLPS